MQSCGMQTSSRPRVSALAGRRQVHVSCTAAPAAPTPARTPATTGQVGGLPRSPKPRGPCWRVGAARRSGRLLAPWELMELQASRPGRQTSPWQDRIAWGAAAPGRASPHAGSHRQPAAGHVPRG